MGKIQEVPVTPKVLDWAIRESGYSVAQVADAIDVDVQAVNEWLAGRSRPGVTAVRALAQTLRRPVASFLLPKPPAHRRPEVKFRHLPGASSRELTPTERRYLRKAHRLQEMLGFLTEQLGNPGPALPSADLDSSPDALAAAFRTQLRISTEAQLEWHSASVAFDGWRVAAESLGVTVFLFQLGAENCRGFSLWHDRAPVVAVNTAWNDEARAFTLFHELGHLITRTSSACTSPAPSAVEGTWDPAERWCERFAAAVLIPEPALKELLRRRSGQEVTRVADFGTVRWLSGKFKASLRAVALRLIELGLANWALYRELPPTGDAKRGGGGGKGRDREEIQEDQLGGRTLDLFRHAVARDVIDRTQALTYLDVQDASIESAVAR